MKRFIKELYMRAVGYGFPVEELEAFRQPKFHIVNIVVATHKTKSVQRYINSLENDGKLYKRHLHEKHRARNSYKPTINI